MERLSSVTLHPFGKSALTTTGVQYSALLTTSTDVYETVEAVTVDLPIEAGRSSEPIVEIEFGLTCEVYSSSTAESVLFKWQASEDNSTWVDIVPAVTYAANASAAKEYTYSGRFATVANFNEVPMYLRLQIQSGGAGGETAKGRTRNSSYVRIVYSDN